MMLVLLMTLAGPDFQDRFVGWWPRQNRPLRQPHPHLPQQFHGELGLVDKRRPWW
jgi:hypothetical protein